MQYSQDVIISFDNKKFKFKNKYDFLKDSVGFLSGIFSPDRDDF